MSVAEALRALQQVTRSIARRHLFEIAGACTGARACARVVVPWSSLEVLSRALKPLGLHAGIPRVQHEVVRRQGEDRFCERRAIARDSAPDATVCVMVARDHATADEAQRMDDWESAADCGRLLGYPPCCVEAYARIEAGEDWLAVTRQGLPGGAIRLPASSNVLEGLFSSDGLHPDFFPCRLGCPAATGLVDRLLQAGLDCGLAREHDAGLAAMRGPMTILDGAVLRSARPGERALAVVRPGRDPRWATLLADSETRVEAVANGLRVHASEDTFEVAGTLVEFA